jgi:acyl carrier protein
MKDLCMNAAETVRKFIVEQFLFGEDDGFKDDASFMETGLIDSMGIMEMVAFLEKTFQIKIEDHELIPRNLDSVSRIQAFLDFKTKKTG